MEQIYTQIRQYIDENRQPMLNLWRDLVNTESGTMQIDGVNAVCSILRREMENAGIHTRVRAIQNSGDMLIGEWNPGSSKAPLLLIGHMDTVFKEGAAKDNPFRVDENGMAHGPGVLDMKAGLVMALYTVKALDSVDWKERPIKFIFASDEENLHMRSDAKEIFAEEAAGALAAFNFETGYMDNRFVVGRKGGGPVSIRIHGRASHSGIAPEKGRSAVLEAAHKIVEIESQNDIMRGRLMNCGMVDGGIGLYDQSKMIIARLKDPVLMTPSNRSMCDRVMRSNLVDIIVQAARHDDRQVVDDMLDLGYLTKDNIDIVVERAGDVQDAAMTGYLLEVKRRFFGSQLMDFDL